MYFSVAQATSHPPYRCSSRLCVRFQGKDVHSGPQRSETRPQVLQHNSQPNTWTIKFKKAPVKSSRRQLTVDSHGSFTARKCTGTRRDSVNENVYSDRPCDLICHDMLFRKQPHTEGWHPVHRSEAHVHCLHSCRSTGWQQRPLSRLFVRPHTKHFRKGPIIPLAVMRRGGIPAELPRACTCGARLRAKLSRFTRDPASCWTISKKTAYWPAGGGGHCRRPRESSPGAPARAACRPRSARYTHRRSCFHLRDRE